MFPDLGAIWQDAVVLGYMCGLRVGVPLLITIMLGKYLQRRLEERDREELAARHAFCWDSAKTIDSERASRASALRPDLPCWLALQVSGGELTEKCYDCPLFSVRAARQGAARPAARPALRPVQNPFRSGMLRR
jgi:hypothetical protein